MPFQVASPAAPQAGQKTGLNPYAEPDSETFGTWLSGRISDLQRSDTSNLHFANVQTAFAHLYGLDVEGVGANAAVVTRSGEQGSIAQLRIPNAAVMLEKAWNIIVGPELTWSTVATTSDFASEAQSVLMKNALQYYWNDIGIGPKAKEACKSGLAFGEGALHLPWDPTLGEDAAVDGQQAVKSGDIACRIVETWDIIRDPTAKSFDALQAIMIREFRNRFDVAAAVVSMEGESPDETENRRNACLSSTMTYEYWSPFGISRTVDTDLIPVYTLYHKPTGSIPTGRQFEMLADGTPLADGDLDPAYRDVLPLVRYAAGEYKGTCYPYSKWFGTLGAQQASDGVYKDLLTNVTATSGCVISCESDSDTAPFNLTGGPQIHVRGKGEKEPVVLQLQQSNPEAYKLIGALDNSIQRRMGIDPLTAGTENASSQLSGAAMAMLTSTSVQNNSQEQARWSKFVQDIGTVILNHIIHHMPQPRRIALAGNARSSLVTATELSGPAVAGIKRVQCTLGTALSQTDAFKLEFSTMLMKGDGKTSWVQTPQQLQTVIDTGRADALTQDLSNELLLINSENEALGKGEQIPAVLDDDHRLHLKLHKSVTSSLAARKNPDVIAALQAHQDMHIQILQTTDPGVLAALGQQPLPQPAQPGMPPQGPQAGGPPGAPHAPPPGAGPPGAPGPSGPPMKQAEPPKPPEMQQQAKAPSMPTVPSTGQKAGPVAGTVSPSLAIRPS